MLRRLSLFLAAQGSMQDYSRYPTPAPPRCACIALAARGDHGERYMATSTAHSRLRWSYAGPEGRVLHYDADNGMWVVMSDGRMIYAARSDENDPVHISTAWLQNSKRDGFVVSRLKAVCSNYCATPTLSPTTAPTLQPSLAPTGQPTSVPTHLPGALKRPITPPPIFPFTRRTGPPTKAPTGTPSANPTQSPTAAPTELVLTKSALLGMESKWAQGMSAVYRAKDQWLKTFSTPAPSNYPTFSPTLAPTSAPTPTCHLTPEERRVCIDQVGGCCVGHSCSPPLLCGGGGKSLSFAPVFAKRLSVGDIDLLSYLSRALDKSQQQLLLASLQANKDQQTLATECVLGRFASWNRTVFGMVKCSLSEPHKQRCMAAHGCCVGSSCLPSQICAGVSLGRSDSTSEQHDSPQRRQERFMDVVLPRSWSDAFRFKDLQSLLGGSSLRRSFEYVYSSLNDLQKQKLSLVLKAAGKGPKRIELVRIISRRFSFFEEATAHILETGSGFPTFAPTKAPTIAPTVNTDVGRWSAPVQASSVPKRPAVVSAQTASEIRAELKHTEKVFMHSLVYAMREKGAQKKGTRRQQDAGVKSECYVVFPSGCDSAKVSMQPHYRLPVWTWEEAECGSISKHWRDHCTKTDVYASFDKDAVVHVISLLDTLNCGIRQPCQRDSLRNADTMPLCVPEPSKISACLCDKEPEAKLQECLSSTASEQRGLCGTCKFLTCLGPTVLLTGAPTLAPHHKWQGHFINLNGKYSLNRTEAAANDGHTTFTRRVRMKSKIICLHIYPEYQTWETTGRWIVYQRGEDSKRISYLRTLKAFADPTLVPPGAWVPFADSVRQHFVQGSFKKIKVQCVV